LEKWEIIKSHPYYLVSDYGRVMRVVEGSNTYPGRILKIRTNNHGYACVSLAKRKQPIHKLVMEAFIGPCPNGKEVNHKDGNKKNSCLENLEYVTRQQNTQHAYDIGLINREGEKNGRAKLKEGEVWLIKKLCRKNIKYKIIQRMFNISDSCIWAIKFGHNWGWVK
jgi:hypothetical protein